MQVPAFLVSAILSSRILARSTPEQHNSAEEVQAQQIHVETEMTETEQEVVEAVEVVASVPQVMVEEAKPPYRWCFTIPHSKIYEYPYLWKCEPKTIKSALLQDREKIPEYIQEALSFGDRIPPETLQMVLDLQEELGIKL
jgi:hypothetical protein